MHRLTAKLYLIILNLKLTELQTYIKLTGDLGALSIAFHEKTFDSCPRVLDENSGAYNKSCWSQSA